MEYEGQLMGMCVGGDSYKTKIKNERSIIISLRDDKNLPHVTTEIDVKSGTVVQQYGKGNTVPLPEYKKMLLEFVLFATNYTKTNNNETLRLLNLSQTL